MNSLQCLFLFNLIYFIFREFIEYFDEQSPSLWTAQKPFQWKTTNHVDLQRHLPTTLYNNNNNT